MSTELTVFFDSRCPLCAAEMRWLSRRDKHARLAFIDMHADGFDAAAYGTNLAAMDAELHAQTADGRMRVGIDAVAATYQAIGLGWLVWPLTPALTRPLWQGAYRWFARNRYRVSRWFGFRCVDGVCAARGR